MLDFLRLKKQTSLIDKDTLITEAQYIVLDTELTGLNQRKDSIVSIGAIKMSGTRIALGNAFYRLINPETKFNPESVVIHGITPSDVMQKPNVDSILTEFLQFCNDNIIVGHCILIDLSFINREMKRIFNNTMQNSAIDTLRVYEWLRKKIPSRTCFSSSPKESSLYEIAKCFDISVHGAHDALIDSFITAQLLQRFIPSLIEVGVKHIGDLLELGDPKKGGEELRLSGEISNF